jgi:hypothetical protein
MFLFRGERTGPTFAKGAKMGHPSKNGDALKRRPYTEQERARCIVPLQGMRWGAR